MDTFFLSLVLDWWDGGFPLFSLTRVCDVCVCVRSNVVGKSYCTNQKRMGRKKYSRRLNFGAFSFRLKVKFSQVATKENLKFKITIIYLSCPVLWGRGARAFLLSGQPAMKEPARGSSATAATAAAEAASRACVSLRPGQYEAGECEAMTKERESKSELQRTRDRPGDTFILDPYTVSMSTPNEARIIPWEEKVIIQLCIFSANILGEDNLGLQNWSV